MLHPRENYIDVHMNDGSNIHRQLPQHTAHRRCRFYLLGQLFFFLTPLEQRLFRFGTRAASTTCWCLVEYCSNRVDFFFPNVSLNDFSAQVCPWLNFDAATIQSNARIATAEGSINYKFFHPKDLRQIVDSVYLFCYCICF